MLENPAAQYLHDETDHSTFASSASRKHDARLGDSQLYLQVEEKNEWQMTGMKQLESLTRERVSCIEDISAQDNNTQPLSVGHVSLTSRPRHRDVRRGLAHSLRCLEDPSDEYHSIS